MGKSDGTRNLFEVKAFESFREMTRKVFCVWRAQVELTTRDWENEMEVGRV